MADSIDSKANTQPRPDPNEKLVKVFDSELESEAIIVKGLLESVGIDSDLTAASMVQETFPGLGGMIILVRQADAEAAQKLIAEHQHLPAQDDDETAEFEIMEDPSQKGETGFLPDRRGAAGPVEDGGENMIANLAVHDGGGGKSVSA